MNPSLESWIDPVALRQLRAHFDSAELEEATAQPDCLVVPDDDDEEDAAHSAPAGTHPDAQSLAAADALLARFGSSATAPLSPSPHAVSQSEAAAAAPEPTQLIATVQNAARVAGASEYFLVTPASSPGRSTRIHCATTGSEAAIDAALGLASAWEQGLRRLGSQVHSALHVDLGQGRQLAIIPLAVHGITHCLGFVVEHSLDAQTIELVRGAVADALR